MRTIQSILLLALALPLAAQTAPASKSTPAKSAAAKPADAVPATPPANAEQIDSATFHWKDAKGDLWIYKKTPFGWSRSREKDLPPVKRQDSERPPMVVREVRGDDVVFERPSPFGQSRWTKKKDALSADEQAALDRWSKRGAEAARTASAGKE